MDVNVPMSCATEAVMLHNLNLQDLNQDFTPINNSVSKPHIHDQF